MNSEFVCCIS